MNFSEYLDAEWVPALGCTEPASIGLAAATASAQASGSIRVVKVRCNPRIYKNCYAVGIPYSRGKIGGHWAAALGALAADPSVGLEVFRQNTPERIATAQVLMDEGSVTMDVDTTHQELWIDCHVEREKGSGRAVIAGDHTSVIRIQRNGKVLLGDDETTVNHSNHHIRRRIAGMKIEELFAFLRTMTDEDRERLEEGIALNMAIARHGEKLFPEDFAVRDVHDTIGRAARLASGGVYARMSGEDLSVMSLAGSGNKGITTTVPLVLWAEKMGASRRRMQESLALGALMTSATTHHLGTLSAMCGCANAAGIGLAAGRVYMEGGTEDAVSRAINNMVGNIAGIICDGAKIGCGMKALTAVDAATRSTELAMAGIGIPVTDGIVGSSPHESLANLGRIARGGMAVTDDEILDIMHSKNLSHTPDP